ncbi:helix-turn-helix domain-containing protein [Arthrobacter sp. CAN_A6]|uniref:helix-turn-helix domain-containing protein n=1 Tax=unclassified Arthrobacter TaxID=235627 RepID=UPI003FA4A9DF
MGKERRRHSLTPRLVAALHAGIHLPRSSRRRRKLRSLSEREQIHDLHVPGDSIRAIARALGRAPSTIGRELDRNTATAAGYLPYATHRRSPDRRRPGRRTAPTPPAPGPAPRITRTRPPRPQSNIHVQPYRPNEPRQPSLPPEIGLA